MKYPHLNSKTQFPDVSGVDVYKFDNDFDYSRYDRTQMELNLCKVPWDMGEAHIGARTISGIGNVVHFKTKARRDAWFDAIPQGECVRLTTKYKELHSSNEILVPVPFDIASRYNYLEVKYHLFANDESPVQYERDGGIDHWFWFIRECVFVAPNTTKLILMNDAWQTFIYDISVSEMMLERGHAPMAAVSADKYLADPLANCEGLLAEDEQYSDEAGIVSKTAPFIFNDGTIHAVVVTTANPFAEWGAKATDSWLVPAQGLDSRQGVPQYNAISMTAANFPTWFANVYAQTPQFFQTVKGVYFISSKLVTLGTARQWGGVNCYLLSAAYRQNKLYTLDKSDFGYPSRYADIAKLYTYPYCHLEISDENGNAVSVKVEDTRGTLQVQSCVNLALPWVSIDAHVEGIGQAGAQSLRFSALSARTMPIQGNWYAFSKRWNIPTYGLVMQASDEYDYSTHFDRKQRALENSTARANALASNKTAYDNALASNKTAYDNALASNETAYDNALASNETAYDNALASNQAAYGNASASANTMVSNADLQIAANLANTTAGQNFNTLNTEAKAQLNNVLTSAGISYANETANNEIEAKQASTSVSNAQGAFGGAVSGAVSGFSTGGAVGAAAGAVGGLIGAAVNAQFANAQVAIAANLTGAQTAASNSFNSNSNNSTNIYNRSSANGTNNLREAEAENTNDLIESTTANSAATQIANAGRTKTAGDANAARTKSTGDGNAARTKSTGDGNAARTKSTGDGNTERSYSTAQAGIASDINQAALRAPLEFGEFANGDTGVTRPQGIFCNVVTQSPDAIARTGDAFLRYGYAYNRRWDFSGDWCVMKNFTYWKLSDFWISGLNVPDMYVDKIRFFLFGGVTVWDNPAKIGNVSIYDN